MEAGSEVGVVVVACFRSDQGLTIAKRRDEVSRNGSGSLVLCLTLSGQLRLVNGVTARLCGTYALPLPMSSSQQSADNVVSAVPCKAVLSRGNE